MCGLGEIDVRLDSSGAPEAWIFRAGPAEAVLWCQSIHGPAVLRQGSGEERAWEEPLEALQWMSASQQEGRWIGFLSYDLGKRFERLPARAVDELGLPAFVFSRHRGGSSERGLTLPVRRETPGHVRSHFSRSEYQAAVARAIEYVRAGDVFQVNLSQRFSVECELPAREVYARLTEKTPAKFGALLDYGRFALVSNSPELFFRVGTDRKIITRPIKGTRPIGTGMEEELRASVKDQAELNMIVDLERNDLGRVCEIGSVRVSQPRVIEKHPTVYHGVAEVEGQLRGDVGFVDLLRAVFPGGSVTGAPKIRAMEIIDELEPVSRGPYCGAIGYLDGDGSMQFNMAIRTMILKQGRAHIPVGGGIVADSQPAEEYEETLVKARAMFAAIGVE